MRDGLRPPRRRGTGGLQSPQRLAAQAIRPWHDQVDALPPVRRILKDTASAADWQAVLRAQVSFHSVLAGAARPVARWDRGPAGLPPTLAQLRWRFRVLCPPGTLRRGRWSRVQRLAAGWVALGAEAGLSVLARRAHLLTEARQGRAGLRYRLLTQTGRQGAAFRQACQAWMRLAFACVWQQRCLWRSP
ncbi:MAG: hypothetical protein SF002_17145 [Alphaproteobacteria bacterium]|nr:hypothetical protein [Alphaproteobacteria bacterium]